MGQGAQQIRAIAAACLVACAVAVPASTAVGRVAVVAPTYLRTIGGPGHADTYPGGVDVDPTGVLYIADTGNDRVEAYRPDGTVRWSQGVRTVQKAPGNFDNPRDVAYLAGKLYVADLGNKRVQVLDAATGTPLEAWSVTLPSPIGISAGVDGAGNAVILVSQDTENQVAEYTPSGALVRTIGAPGGGSGDGQLSAPRDAATDAAGNIY